MTGRGRMNRDEAEEEGKGLHTGDDQGKQQEQRGRETVCRA